jgi:hypothetical protein
MCHRVQKKELYIWKKTSSWKSPKQHAQSPNKRVKKLLLEFAVPGNKAALAKKLSSRQLWWILISTSQSQAPKRRRIRFPTAAVGACIKESFWCTSQGDSDSRLTSWRLSSQLPGQHSLELFLHWHFQALLLCVNIGPQPLSMQFS